MKSRVVKRSIVIAGHKTSVSLEDGFWKSLKEIAGERHMTLSELVAAIDTDRQHGNLSSAIRLFVDWATWVKNERGQRYTLRFITSRNVTWQKTAFMALMSLTKEVLAIEHVT